MTHPAIDKLSARITAREGRSIADCPPLYDAIDPEALAALLDSEGAVTVRFEYDGSRVVIRSDPLDVAVIDDDR